MLRWTTEALVTVRGDIHQWKIEAWRVIFGKNVNAQLFGG